ncbi:MAG: hypothetical protein PVG07_08735, partial [Acidobacteriota bacterium]
MSRADPLGVPFYKVSGAGNDFIAIPEPPAPPSAPGNGFGDDLAGLVTPERVRAWCARRLSVGADGLFLLAREGSGTVRMTH